MLTRPPNGTANKSGGEKVAQKYRSDFRLVSERIDAALASTISQRANYLRLASSLPLARNDEATTLGSQKDKPGIQETDFEFREDSNKWN